MDKINELPSGESRDIVTTSPETVLLLKGHRDIVHEAISKLGNDKIIAQLFFFDGISIKDLAIMFEDGYEKTRERLVNITKRIEKIIRSNPDKAYKDLVNSELVWQSPSSLKKYLRQLEEILA